MKTGFNYRISFVVFCPFFIHGTDNCTCISHAYYSQLMPFYLLPRPDLHERCCSTELLAGKYFKIFEITFSGVSWARPVLCTCDSLAQCSVLWHYYLSYITKVNFHITSEPARSSMVTYYAKLLILKYYRAVHTCDPS